MILINCYVYRRDSSSCNTFLTLALVFKITKYFYLKLISHFPTYQCSTTLCIPILPNTIRKVETSKKYFMTLNELPILTLISLLLIHANGFDFLTVIFSSQFIMACGKLVKILLHSKVTRYLEFKSVDGSYVFKDGKVQKVPATPAEALNSSLMGFFEKRKFRQFLVFLSAYDKDKPSTYMKGQNS